MNKLIAKTCVNTCTACPSAWHIDTENGQSIYVRFRWGRFSARLIHNQKLLYEWYSGDMFDGVMNTEDMILHLSDVIDFSSCKFE